MVFSGILLRQLFKFYVLVDLWCGLESKTNRSQWNRCKLSAMVDRWVFSMVVHSTMYSKRMHGNLFKDQCHHKMKFPVSVLPATVCAKEMFNHGCMLIIAFITLLLCGYFPNIHWLGIIYYAFCAFMFAEAVSLILSVLTMLYRDIRKLVKSLIRMFMYFHLLFGNAILPAMYRFIIF